MDEREIRELLGEGYRPYRRRYRNGFKISLRKGDSERIAGPYSDYLWDWIASEIQALEPSARNWADEERIIRLLAQRRAMAMAQSCVNVEGRHCTFWSFNAGDMDRLARLSPRGVPADASHIHVVANIITCMNCSGYEPRQRRP